MHITLVISALRTWAQRILFSKHPVDRETYSILEPFKQKLRWKQNRFWLHN